MQVSAKIVCHLRGFLLLLLLALSGLAACYLDSPPSSLEHLVARLTASLKDQDPEIRHSAAEALGKVGQPGGSAALLEALGDPDHRVRAASVWAIGRVAAGEVQVGIRVAGLLDDSSEEVKQVAAQTLGDFQSTPVLVERLIASLQSADVSTRRAAVSALASIEASAAYPALVAVLHDEDVAVRQGAVSALGELADSRAIPFLRERGLTDPASGVRSEAAFRLGKMGDRGAMEALQIMAKNDQDAAVRRWAQWASRQITSSLGSD